MNKRMTVPLALDSELSMSVPGAGNLPTRTILAMVIMGLPALAIFIWGTPIGVMRYFIAAMLVMAAMLASLPRTDGIWVGTQLVYRMLDRWLPTGTNRGHLRRVKRAWAGNALMTTAWNKARVMKVPPFGTVGELPELDDVDEGAFSANPGGWRGVLKVVGPNASPGSAEYQLWSHNLMLWISSLECPVQMYSVVDHFDAQAATSAFERRLKKNIRPSILISSERELVENLAATSLEVTTYLVIDPGLAGGDGQPYGSWILDASSWRDTEREMVKEKTQLALRTADGFGIKARLASIDQIRELLARTPLGAEQVVATEKATQIRGEVGTTFHLPHVVTRLPRSLGSGELMDVLIQSHSKALVNVTIAPMSMRAARKKLDRIIKARNYAADHKGPSAVEDPMVAAEGQAVLELLAQGIKPVNLAISFSLYGDTLEEAEEAQERVMATMHAKGFEVVEARQPALWPMLACSPGGAPLKRSLILTIDLVAERLIPSIGTSFGDPRDALIGLNLFTGAPAYWDVWGVNGEINNHNMLMLATSGAGKSVTLKTMLYRHAIAGTDFIVLDPDSEYRQLVAAVGGDYYELGDEALNAFAVVLHYEPTEAASAVLQMLAIMAGDAAFDTHGQSVRRMKDEDKSWLHDQLTQFFEQLTFGRELTVEPTLKDFVDYMETRVQNRARNEQEAERARKIQERLAFYCKGRLGEIFNRRSTFELGGRPVGVGFSQIINSYAADMTPALAVVLTAIYSLMAQARRGRFLVVVDEASYLTSNPDAGQVLEQIARRGRKAGMGVWMASQELDDFVDTPLGKALSAVSSTKWILGCQEETLKAISTSFGLTADELAALNPVVRGRGLLLTDGGERAVVEVIPSEVLLEITHTESPELDEREDAA